MLLHANVRCRPPPPWPPPAPQVCRQKAVALLKDVRVQMEESRGAKLRRNRDALAQVCRRRTAPRHLPLPLLLPCPPPNATGDAVPATPPPFPQDLAFAEDNKRHAEDMASAVAQFVAETQRRLQEEAAARGAEAERRQAAAAAAAEAETVAADNEGRRAALAAAQARVVALAASVSELQREKEALRLRVDALQVTLQQSQGQQALVRELAPAAVLHKVRL